MSETEIFIPWNRRSLFTAMKTVDALERNNETIRELAVLVGRLDERMIALDEANQERHDNMGAVLDAKLQSVNARLDEIQSFEASCAIGPVSKDVADIKKYLQDYPPLVWLFRHRTKMMLSWVAFGISMFILTAPWFDRRVLGALLEFVGLPDGIVDVIVGT